MVEAVRFPNGNGSVDFSCRIVNGEVSLVLDSYDIGGGLIVYTSAYDERHTETAHKELSEVFVLAKAGATSVSSVQLAAK